MKFKALPVTSLEDVTLDFEQLQTRDILGLTAESVLQLAATGTARAISFGTGQVSFSASTTSNVVTIAHGIGRTPIAVLANQGDLGSGPITFSAKPVNATNIQVQGVLNFSFTGGPFNFYWIAIG